MRPRHEVHQVVLPLQHHPAPLEALPELARGVLHLPLARPQRLLQLAQLERAVRAEQNRLQRARQLSGGFLCFLAHRGSTQIAAKRRSCRTRTAPRRSSSRSATNVTTASRRSSDSRISSARSNEPPRSRSSSTSTFLSTVQPWPTMTTGRGGSRCSRLWNAISSEPTSRGCS